MTIQLQASPPSFSDFLPPYPFKPDPGVPKEET